MTKRMIQMLMVSAIVIAGLGFFKFQQFQTMAHASFQPPPEAVTTIITKQETWPATLSAIGSMAPVKGVTVSADLPGTVDKIAFDSGKPVHAGEVLVELDTRQERAQLASAEAQRDHWAVCAQNERHLHEHARMQLAPTIRQGSLYLNVARGFVHDGINSRDLPGQFDAG